MILRSCKDTDKRFIVNSFTNSYVNDCLRKSIYAPGFFRMVPWAVFKKFYFDFFLSLIDQVDVVVACPESDEDSILGWIAYDKDGIFYAYVKELYRYNKVAEALCGKAIGSSNKVDVYFTTPSGKKLMKYLEAGNDDLKFVQQYSLRKYAQ